MKHKNVCAALALEQIDFHSNLIGKNPVAKFDEAQVQKLDEALAQTIDTSALNQQIETQAETIANHVSTETAINAAIQQAFTQNGLELPEGASTVDAIATLSAKCKEYGDSTDTHSFPKSDGKDKNPDGLVEGYIDPNAEHNQLLTKLLS